MTLSQYKEMPKFVQQLCELFDCMIVGSTATGAARLDSDIDLIVPFDKWQTCASYIVNNSWVTDLGPNRFGGWKFMEIQTYKKLDVWPMTLEAYFTTSRTSPVYWPKHALTIVPNRET